MLVAQSLVPVPLVRYLVGMLLRANQDIVGLALNIVSMGLALLLNGPLSFLVILEHYANPPCHLL